MTGHLRRLRGDERPLAADEDWPGVGEVLPADWYQAVASLRELDTEILRAVAAFPAERLDEPGCRLAV